MKQILKLPYETKEKAPIQLYFISHDPFNFKQDVEYNGATYEVTLIERAMIVPKINLLGTSQMTTTQQPKKFYVSSMDDVFEHIEDDVSEVFLVRIDIKDGK